MEREIRKVVVGDRIRAVGHTFDVAKILYQDTWMGYDDRDGADRSEKSPMYDVEFLDRFGGYHHWKSNLDGGKILD